MYLELLLGRRENDLSPINPDETQVGPIFQIGETGLVVTHGTWVMINENDRLSLDSYTGTLYYNGWYYAGFRVLSTLTAEMSYRLQTYNVKLALTPDGKAPQRQPVRAVRVFPSLN